MKMGIYQCKQFGHVLPLYFDHNMFATNAMYEHFNDGKGGFSGLNLQAVNTILLTLTMEEFEFIHEPLRCVGLFLGPFLPPTMI